MASAGERDYAIALAACPGLEPGTLRRLIEGCDGAYNVWEGDSAAWKKACRLSDRTVSVIEGWRTRVRNVREVEPRLFERGITAVHRTDREYPGLLRDLQQPPEVVFVKGNPTSLSNMCERQQTVSVVGTRRASAYGLEATRWVVGTIASRGWHVVSGLALGIDVCAHQSALTESGMTSAVLACGVDLCYPVNHKRTYDAIVAGGGCVVSEYPPGTPVAKHRFPERNRLIAALATTLIVVQAGEKSGALTTAEIALDLGRDIYVVPGPITSAHFLGSNRLLSEGAALLLNPEEFLADHGQVVEGGTGHANPPERWRTLYEALSEPLGADMLAHVLGVPVSHVYAGLLELELEGWIERRQGAVYGRSQQNLHPNSARC